MKKQVLALMVSATVFATNPAFGMEGEDELYQGSPHQIILTEMNSASVLPEKDDTEPKSLAPKPSDSIAALSTLTQEEIKELNSHLFDCPGFQDTREICDENGRICPRTSLRLAPLMALAPASMFMIYPLMYRQTSDTIDPSFEMGGENEQTSKGLPFHPSRRANQTTSKETNDSRADFCNKMNESRKIVENLDEKSINDLYKIFATERETKKIKTPGKETSILTLVKKKYAHSTFHDCKEILVPTCEILMRSGEKLSFVEKKGIFWFEEMYADHHIAFTPLSQTEPYRPQAVISGKYDGKKLLHLTTKEFAELFTYIDHIFDTTPENITTNVKEIYQVPIGFDPFDID